MKHFVWQTPEYVHTVKTSDWYWAVGIVSGAFVITAAIFGNFLFAIVLAIAAFTLTMFASYKPKIISVEISDKGIVVDKVMYPFHALEAFFVDESHHHGPRLILKSKKVIVPLISVPINYHNTEELDAFLGTHLKPEVFEQSLLQTVLERFGF